MRWLDDDGGRFSAGYRGDVGDCVVRSIAIATGKPYAEVYQAISVMAKEERPRNHKKSSARNGVYRITYQQYLESLGWKWHATMGIGTGCKVHLRDGELPSGRLIVRVSKHITAVIDGVIHDTADCSRDGWRCVYGYFSKDA